MQKVLIFNKIDYFGLEQYFFRNEGKIFLASSANDFHFIGGKYENTEQTHSNK